jgi:hypothetical protein
MWKMALFAAALFWLLVPGNFVTFPAGASRSTVNLVHAALFGVAWALTHKMVWHFVSGK